MRNRRSNNHTRTKHNQHPAMTNRLLISRSCTEFIICREDLDQDGAEFACPRADSVAGGAVPRWEDLSGDDVCCCVGAEVE